MLDATVEYTDNRGFHHIAVSESWKTLCLDFPCSERAVPALDEFPAASRPALKAVAEKMIGDIVGWAESGPRTRRPFLTASPTEPAGGYWMSRWMGYGSYAAYVASEHFHIPHEADDYVMDFSVKGKRFRWAHPDSPIEVLQ